MTYVVVASVSLDADPEALAQATGKPAFTYEAKYSESEGPRVRRWDFEDHATAEQAVARLNKIPGVSAEIREDGDEPNG